MKLNKKEKSFTLIELLVVIAVIGLISSIVLVNLDLPSQRKKAQIARSLEFSQSIQNILGSEGVGTWNFDEGSGSTARDSSGYGNNGTNNGAVFSDDTPHKMTGNNSGKYALYLNGASNVDVSNFGKSVVNKNEITIEAWLKPMINSGEDDFLWYSTASDKRITIHFPWGNSIVWQFADFNNCNVSLNLNQDWLNVWAHYVFVASDSKNFIKIYRNGSQVAENTCSTPTLPSSSASLYLGGRPSYGFYGFIDEARIYGQALSVGQIQSNYAKGLQKRNLVLK